MSVNKSRTAAFAALMGMTLVLALMAWRGIRAVPDGDDAPELVWRQAGVEDLFRVRA